MSSVKRLIFNLTFITALIFYLGVVSICSFLLLDRWQLSYGLFFIIIPLLLLVGYKPIKKGLLKIMRKILFFPDYDIDEVVSQIDDILVPYTLDLKKMVNDIMIIICNAFSSKKILFFLLEKDEQCLVPYHQVGLSEEDTVEFSRLGNFCTRSRFLNHIKRNKDIINIHNLRFVCRHDKKDICRVIGELKDYSVSLVVPVHSSKKLLGCFFLDEKKVKEQYTKRDFKLLKIISQKIASQLENARLYTELSNLSLALQEKVDKATKKLKASNKKLKELAEAKSDFLSIIAHQLRAPLTVVKGYLSMLHEGTMGKLNKKQKSAVIKAYRSNNDLIDLVENLLNFSRIEDNRIKFNFIEVDLNRIVKYVLEQFELQLAGKHLKVHINKESESLPPIRGDFNKLRNVVANLLDNAIKYTADGGTINIDMTTSDKEIIFEMTDSGIGMVTEDAKHLFKKFFRNDEMSFKHIQGTGLGLYIVQRFIVAHGGRVWASSPGRDRGSTFGFSLPLIGGKKISAAKKG
jgi:signal transduction histidine kinase